jgi:hypothetical protein
MYHVIIGTAGITVTLRDSLQPDRLRATISVFLPNDRAVLIVRPRIENDRAVALNFKWWDNAMLAPGPANTVGPDLQIIFPGSEVTVHSTGDPALPGGGQPMAWPVYGGRDFSHLNNWRQYLGVFQRPAATGSYVGVYDRAADEGMLRLYPNDVARGAKLFSPGFSAPLDPKLWTDDGSAYVELHGGVMPTFDDWYELPAGDEITWSEIWYPVAGIGPVTQADGDVALSVRSDGDMLRIGIFPTSPLQGQVTIAVQGMEPVARAVDIDPAQPLTVEIPLAAGVPAQAAVAVDVVDADGALMLSSQTQVQVR